MNINAATKLTLESTLITRSRRFFGQITDKSLPRLAAFIAILALLIPTLFIIPFPKVSAREATPIIISAPPESFEVGSRKSAVGSWQLAVGSWQLAVGSRQSAVGSRQSAVGSRQSAVGSQQSAVSSQQSADKFNHFYV